MPIRCIAPISIRGNTLKDTIDTSRNVESMRGDMHATLVLKQFVPSMWFSDVFGVQAEDGGGGYDASRLSGQE